VISLQMGGLTFCSLHSHCLPKGGSLNRVRFLVIESVFDQGFIFSIF
jgi:hypothetical protein